jgi:hypothetical protein
MLFAELDIPAVIGTSIPLAGIAVAIVAILSVNWRKAKVSEHRAVLVQNMVDKGFSPGEIVRVLEASDLNVNGPLPHRRAERV